MMYLIWSVKVKGKEGSAAEEGATDGKKKKKKKKFPQPLTTDQLQSALDYIEYCGQSLMDYEMAVMLERVANCFEENGDLEEAMDHRSRAFDLNLTQK